MLCPSRLLLCVMFEMTWSRLVAHCASDSMALAIPLGWVPQLSLKVSESRFPDAGAAT